MTRRPLRVCCMLVWVLLLVANPAGALADDGDEDVQWSGAAVTVSTDATAVPASTSDVKVVPWGTCDLDNDGAISINDACVTDCITADDERGTRYSVLIDGEFSEWICVVPSDAGEVTPDRVLRAFQRLDWPSSDLIVQPPDGQTLVNFDTNFLTDNTDTIRQQVTLLGQRITIEAWPRSYTWSFGDGAEVTTESAGQRYPALDVTHRYLQQETYAPSVATTYAGRYRVGGGAWVDIPGTHTVDGPSVSLEVVEASPVLVAPDGG